MTEDFRTIVILGMHRSATSLVARTLHEAQEVWMGHRLILEATGSEGGLYEHGPIVDLNWEILVSAGGEWDNPPSREAILAAGAGYRDRIIAVLREFEDVARGHGITRVGFKDPRLCLTIELWAPHLTAPQYITSFRSHEAIARSLFARDGMPIERGIELSREYHRRILAFLEKTYGT